jgi:hypothetical protein
VNTRLLSALRQSLQQQTARAQGYQQSPGDLTPVFYSIGVKAAASFFFSNEPKYLANGTKRMTNPPMDMSMGGLLCSSAMRRQ